MAGRTRLQGAQRLVFRGYGPLVAQLLLFLLVVTLTPSVAREQMTSSSGGGPGGRSAVGTAGGDGGEAATDPVRQPGAAAPGEEAITPGDACSDRAQQVPGDPYSPPCIAWPEGGSNGGDTYQGVTGDTIKVSFRIPADPVDINQLQAQLADATGVKESPDDIERTLRGLVDYFNQSFQLYGRRIEPVVWRGSGQALSEIIGGGLEGANADATRVAKEIKAFADLSAITPPYADALSEQGVMAFGAPYMSQSWYEEHAPYAWSFTPDCTRLVGAGAKAVNRLLFDQPAQWAGEGLQGKTRKVGLISPEVPWYAECIEQGERLMEAEGNRLGGHYRYQVDLSSMSNQAASLVARLKADQITTVVLGVDPIMLVFLTAKATEQGYFPEWLMTGVALQDTDVVGQLVEPEQWKRAFGASALGTQQPQRATLGYAAYKSVRDDEPSVVVDFLYTQLYFAVVGFQLAGPNLTPESFAAGLATYPEAFGPMGTLAFPAGTYTPQQDAMLVWWDPDEPSIYNGAPGSYQTDGKRYRFDELPTSWPAEMFR